MLRFSSGPSLSKVGNNRGSEKIRLNFIIAIGVILPHLPHSTLWISWPIPSTPPCGFHDTPYPPHPTIRHPVDFMIHSYHNNWYHSASGSGRSNIYYLTPPTSPHPTHPVDFMKHPTLPPPCGFHDPPHPGTFWAKMRWISWGPSLCLPFGRQLTNRKNILIKCLSFSNSFQE